MGLFWFILRGISSGFQYHLPSVLYSPLGFNQTCYMDSLPEDCASDPSLSQILEHGLSEVSAGSLDFAPSRPSCRGDQPPTGGHGLHEVAPMRELLALAFAPQHSLVDMILPRNPERVECAEL